jgi:hypothetical protein
VISQCISLLENRNLKPFGAARAIEFALSTSPHLFQDEGWRKVSDFLNTAVQTDVTKATESPATKHLISCLNLLGTFDNFKDDFNKLWAVWVGGLLGLPATEARDTLLGSLISEKPTSALARDREDVQSLIVDRTLSNLSNEVDSFPLLSAAVTNGALSASACESLVRELVAIIHRQPQPSGALNALEIVVRGQPQVFASNEELQMALVGRLLSISELGNESVSAQAATIRSLLDSHSVGTLPLASIVQSNLEHADARSLE